MHSKMAEEPSISPGSSSIREGVTPSEVSSCVDEKETLLGASDQGHEETQVRHNVEKVVGILKTRMASSNIRFLVWTAINTLATIAIVSHQ
jgi:hypothetical protein